MKRDRPWIAQRAWVSLSGRGNNFDCLRTGAAVAALISHSVPISSGRDSRELFSVWSGGQTALGHLAVCIFL